MMMLMVRMTMARLLLWFGLIGLLQRVHIVHKNRSQVESEQHNQMTHEQQEWRFCARREYIPHKLNSS